jgi:phosphate/sulfate permease
MFLASVLFPVDLAAQGQPVQNGSVLPVAIWWVGSCILGLVLAYGILRNRSRTSAEKRLTEKATKNLHAEEERDRIRSDNI